MNLLLAIALFSGCFLLGDRIQRLANWKDYRESERFIFGLASGLVLSSFLVTLLAFAGGVTPLSSGILLASFFIAYWGHYSALLASLKTHWNRSKKNLFKALTRHGVETALAWALALLIFIGLVWAQAPPARQDALVYHLAIPKAYLEAQGVINLPNNKYSFYPLLNEMNFLWAMSLRKEPLPQLVGFGLMLLLAAALMVFSRRFLPERWGLAPAVLYLATPTFLETGSQGYIDVATALWAFLAYYAWERWYETRRRLWSVRLMLFSAAALASKLTVFIIVPLTVLGIAIHGKREPVMVSLRRLALYGLALTLLLGPWWVRNAHYSGNPFTPFLMGTLGGADQINWDDTRSRLEARMVREMGTGNGFSDFLALPYSLTFQSHQHGLPFDGNIGILYFMLLPSLLWLHWRGSTTEARLNRMRILVVGIYMVMWFLYFKGIRFLAPPFTLLSILLAVGTARMMNRFSFFLSWWRPLALAALAGGLFFNLHIIGQEWFQTGPAAFLSGNENRDAYLARRIEPYPLYQEMNRRLGPKDQALFVYMRNYGYLANVSFHSDSLFEAHTLQQILNKNASPGLVAAEFRRRGFTHLMLDRRFVFGRLSAFPPDQQTLLHRFLETQTRVLAQKGDFFLFELAPVTP